MTEFSLHLANHTTMVVPGSLDAITTYVLLEQEAWFEKELDFLARWIRPGMTIIDIGANLGVYTIPLARQVGSSGRVYAYEPGSAPRSLLQKSIALNALETVQIIGAALSDDKREARLSIGVSSELGSLNDGPTGDGELVPVTALDLEDQVRGWGSPDFVKIDAEGEEERILNGGANFFSRHSPLVMFEIKAGSNINEGLRTAFPAMGYRLYRLLPGGPLLVPDRPGEDIDSYELNLFAAKPDRAAGLAEAGLLVETEATWTPHDKARRAGLTFLAGQAFARSLGGPKIEAATLAPAYRDALAAYAHWRSPAAPPVQRYAALNLACQILVALCSTAATPARLSTLARATADGGYRLASVETLQHLTDQARHAKFAVNEPFWPATVRYDDLDAGGDAANFLMAAAVEQLERSAAYSSYFAPPSRHLGWLTSTRFASTEMLRREVLSARRAGRDPAISERLRTQAADNLNAAYWQGA